MKINNPDNWNRQSFSNVAVDEDTRSIYSILYIIMYIYTMKIFTVYNTALGGLQTNELLLLDSAKSWVSASGKDVSDPFQTNCSPTCNNGASFEAVSSTCPIEKKNN